MTDIQVITPTAKPLRKPAADTPARRASRRLQQRVAGMVVVVPLLAVAAGAIQAVWFGVSGIELSLLGGMYAACIVGASVGFHRLFTHRAFKARQPVRLALGALGSMAAQGPLVYWVAAHRQHHAFSDKDGDPHSPNLHGGGLRGLMEGLWHAHVGWMFTEEIDDWARYAPDILRDRTLFWIHRTYFVWVALGLVLPAALGGVLTGTWLGAAGGLLWGGLVRMFLVNHASWCVGSICHVFGRRPFATGDHSANNYTVALFTFGEGLQNNHHAFPSAAAHAVAWWEPDLSMVLIRILQMLGLVWEVRTPSRESVARARHKARNTRA